MNNRSGNKKDASSRIYRITKYILILLISVAAVWAVATYFGIREQSRVVLREAKNVQMALRLIEIETEGNNERMLDSNSDSGLSKWCENELKSHLGYEPKIELITFNPKDSEKMRFNYYEGDYLVDLSVDVSHRITHTIYYRGFKIRSLE